MMDWLGKMLRLPEAFLAGEAGEGGGVIQVRWRGRGLDSGVQVACKRCFFWRMSRAEP